MATWKKILTDSDSSSFATAAHNHSGTYSEVAHNHSGVYADQEHNHLGLYQPADADLTSIAELTGTSGLLKKTGTGTWALDTISYGTGTVTGVSATLPVASSGGAAPTISLAANYGDTLNPFASKTANHFLSAPNGAAGAPVFRAIVIADIPTLNQATTGSSGSCLGNAATVTNGVYTNGSYPNPAWITSLDKTKVALGNVENTALSTWAGSTNITAIGNATATSLVVSGNLTVSGTTTAIDTSNLNVVDAIISTANNVAHTTLTTTRAGLKVGSAVDASSPQVTYGYAASGNIGFGWNVTNGSKSATVAGILFGAIAPTSSDDTGLIGTFWFNSNDSSIYMKTANGIV